MYQAYNQIFWGAVIILFDLNIGWLNLLPNFAGYLLIAAGLSKIIAENTDTADSAGKARAFAWVLAVYSFAIMFANEGFGGAADAVLLAAVTAADMVMCFLILSAAVNDTNREVISKQQRNYLVITALAVLSSCAIVILPGVFWLSLVLGIASKIYFIAACHTIKRQLNCSDDVQ